MPCYVSSCILKFLYITIVVFVIHDSCIIPFMRLRIRYVYTIDIIAYLRCIYRVMKSHRRLFMGGVSNTELSFFITRHFAPQCL